MGIFSWILLGLIAGALAKFIMPGKDPGGIFVTILIGIVGAILALWLLWPGAIESQTKTDDKAAIRSRALPPDDGKLRIICFGAHPDDAELKAGGVAILWAAQGHHVKFVSVTNGDIAPLAIGRRLHF